MKTIVIGAGKIGYNLLKILTERGYDVTMIEKDKETCMKIAEDINTDIIWGDGTDPEVLKDAGIDKAEIIAAVTGNDEENLVICQIAKLNQNLKRTIARVNNPKNNEMFKQLGIDNTVCSTQVIANLVEFSFDKENYTILNTFERGAMILAELIIRETTFWCNQRIKNLKLPNECVLVSVVRGEMVIYPRGNTQILKNDRVLIITNKQVLVELAGELYHGGTHKWR